MPDSTSAPIDQEQPRVIHGDQSEQAAMISPAFHSPRSVELFHELRSNLEAYLAVPDVDDLAADPYVRLQDWGSR